MNREETIKNIEIMKAWVDGKEIQARELNNAKVRTWNSVVYPSWNFHSCEFRIKPEPMELWIYVNPDGSVVPHGFETECKDCTKKKFREVIE